MWAPIAVATSCRSCVRRQLTPVDGWLCVPSYRAITSKSAKQFHMGHDGVVVQSRSKQFRNNPSSRYYFIHGWEEIYIISILFKVRHFVIEKHLDSTRLEGSPLSRTAVRRRLSDMLSTRYQHLYAISVRFRCHFGDLYYSWLLPQLQLATFYTIRLSLQN